MSETNTRGAAPRLEAGSFAYDNLTSQQKRAFEQALQFVHGVAARAWENPDERGRPADVDLFLPCVDPPRANHVLLIDGGRGSGKTSVMLTLLQVWSAEVRRKPDPIREGLSSDHRKMLEPSGSIVPVGMLDIQPLPKSASLLLHLASPFQRIVEVMERRAPMVRAEKSVRWEPDASPDLASRREWRNFVRAVGLGWEENVQRRASSIDVETYAMELEQAERERLDIRTSFARFMNALVADYKSWASLPIPPLFVLPIDDADMNPGRVVELLEMLRTLWHPRCVFLVTGDSNLFLTTLRGHYLGLLRAPIAGAAAQDNDLEGLDDSDIPQRLAQQVYDKVIPESQRLDMQALDPEERLAFAGTAAAGETSVATGEILARVMVDAHSTTPKQPANLAHYFDLLPEVRQVLPGTLRNLIAVRARLEELERADRLTSANVLLCLWEEALQSSTLLPRQIRALVPKLKLDPQTDLTYVAERMLKSSMYPVGETISQGASHVVQMNAWTADLQERSSANRPQQVSVSLPEAALWVLILAESVTADSCRADSAMFPVVLPNAQFGATTCSIVVRSKVSGPSLLPKPVQLNLRWWTPEWRSPADYILLSNQIRVASQVTDLGTASVDVHVLRFLWSVAHVALYRDVEINPAPSWRGAVAAIAKILALPGESRRERANLQWALARAGLFAVPEFGLQSANELLVALRDESGRWGDIRELLKNSRREYVQAVLRGSNEGLTIDDVYGAIRADASSNHPWYTIVES